MNIRGVYKTSLIDFPGRISTILFSGGCNLRCGYCYNRDLVLQNETLERFSNSDILDLLGRRRKMIDAVVLSGGEPTLSPDIVPFCAKLRELDLWIKIDTNGLAPAVIEELLAQDLVDYIAIDIKTSPEKYSMLAGRNVSFDEIVGTFEAVRKSGVAYEARSTVIPQFFSMDDFKSIGAKIGRVGRYALQQFVPGNSHIDESFSAMHPYRVDELRSLQRFGATIADECLVRGI